MSVRYDALLIVSFGGPQGPDDVMSFLERVTRGRNVPRARLEEVATHYHHFGGTSPIHERTRELVEALREELAPLPVYLGNRHSEPWLEKTVEEMHADGVRRALALATSALSSYSSCRVYIDAIEAARASLGSKAPVIDKLPPFSGHPGYVETCRERLNDALTQLPAGSSPHILFTAHSIPLAMARHSAYEAELRTLTERVAPEGARWQLVYQSRSGPPEIPWLEPDVLDALRNIARREPGASVVLAPFGFIADHMEVVWDLDVEARELATSLGLRLVRAQTANAHPRFVRMVRELVDEAERSPPAPCAPDCCPAPRRP